MFSLPFARTGLRIAGPILLSCILSLPALAQELEPRRWSHLPTGSNFAGFGFVHTHADIFVDPVLLLEDTEMDMDTLALKYIRTFEVFGRSARIDIAQGYHYGRWQGLLDGAPAETRRSGLTDTVLRLSLNLYGTPPLAGKDFAEYRASADVETIVGGGLAVHFPTGQYFDDKLINLGSNRFTFHPQLGVVHNRGKWSVELTGSALIYTDNNDFWGGNRLEEDPLLVVQGHLVYTVRPGLWFHAGIGYGYGGESTVNGIGKDNRNGNLVWSLSLGLPINKRTGIKLAYIGRRTRESTGLDSDSIALAFSTMW